MEHYLKIMLISYLSSLLILSSLLDSCLNKILLQWLPNFDFSNFIITSAFVGCPSTERKCLYLYLPAYFLYMTAVS